MSNDIFDDLTDDEKAVLKREVKHRIQEQRRREQYPNWWTRPTLDMPLKRRIGLAVFFAGIGLILLAVSLNGAIMGAGANPLAAPLILAGFAIAVGGGAFAVRYWN